MTTAPPDQLLNISLAEWGLSIPQAIQVKLLEYLDFLLLGNQKLNLTSIEYPQAVTKHLVDSLAPMKLEGLAAMPGPWFDLGSGGGLPGIPLALVFPQADLVLIEATQKKARFLEECVARFNLAPRVRVVSERAEDLGRGKGREQAGLVFCRAVGKLPTLLELALPLLKENGRLIAYKGPGLAEELEKSAKALQVLKGEVAQTLDFKLPVTEETRSLLVVKKLGATPKGYPRLPGVPAKNPI